MNNEERKNFYMNRNVKLFPSYMALTWDVIFVWTISTLFFSTQKGLTYSQIISLDTILMLSGALLSVPLAQLFKNMKPIPATRIGILGYAVYLTLCMLGNSYIVFAIAQVFMSFAYCVCGLKTNTLLTSSLKLIKRDKDYQRVYGKGLSMFYLIEAFGAIGITYIYNWNPYAAYFASLSIVVLVEVLSLFFRDPQKFQDGNVDLVPNSASSKKTKKKGFAAMGTAFFVALLVYAFFMRGVLSITSSSFKVYLQQMTDFGVIPIWLFGYIYAGIKIAASFAGKYQFKFDLKFGVKSLVLFSTAIILTFFLTGIIYTINSTAIWSVILIVVLVYIQNAIYSPLRIFVNNYMQRCLPNKDIETAYSIRTMVEYFGYAAISAIYAGLLALFKDNYGLTNLVYISILAIPIIVTTGLFIRYLCKEYAKKHTIIKKEYVED